MLRVNQLTGFGQRRKLAAAGPPLITFLSSEVDIANATTYTLTGVIPTRPANWDAVIVIYSASAGGARNLHANSNVAGRPLIQRVAEFETAGTFTYIATAPGMQATDSGDLVLQFTSDVNRLGVGIYEMVNGNPVPTDTDVDQGTDPMNVGLTIPVDGVAVSINAAASTPCTCSWTNLNHDASEVVESTRGFSCAHENALPAGARTITGNWSGTSANECMIAAAFGPA